MDHYKYLNINTELSGNVKIIEMRRAPDNALSINMMEEVISAHQSIAVDQDTRIVIMTSGIDRFYSNGLDMEILRSSDRSQKIKILETLYNMALVVYGFPGIHISLVNGHAMAGGAILAAMSDFRFMTSGPWRFSFNESKLGLVVPEIFLEIIRDFSRVNLARIVLQAKAWKPPEAKEAGIIDETFPPEIARSSVLKFASALLKHSRKGQEETKREMRQKNLELFDSLKEKTISRFYRLLDDDFDRNLGKIIKRRPEK